MASSPTSSRPTSPLSGGLDFSWFSKLFEQEPLPVSIPTQIYKKQNPESLLRKETLLTFNPNGHSLSGRTLQHHIVTLKNGVNIRCCDSCLEEINSLISEFTLFIGDPTKPIKAKAQKDVTGRVLSKVYKLTGRDEPLTHRITYLINRTIAINLTNKAIERFNDKYGLNVLVAPISQCIYLSRNVGVESANPLYTIEFIVKGHFGKGMLTRNGKDIELTSPGKFYAREKINLTQGTSEIECKTKLSAEAFSIMFPILEQRANAVLTASMDLMSSNDLLEAEGIIRISSPQDDMDDFDVWFKEFNIDDVHEDLQNLPKGGKPYFYANVFKRILTKKALITGDDYKRFLSLEPGYSFGDVKGVIDLLSETKRNDLQSVLSFLLKISAKQDKNKMGNDGLARLLAPRIFIPTDMELSNPFEIFKMIEHLQFMLDNFAGLFEPYSGPASSNDH